MRLAIIPAARMELQEAVDYYAAIRPALADALLDELDSAVVAITDYSNAWPSFTTNSRHYLLNRFPYMVVYRIQPGVLKVIAFAHTKRHPDYWKNRH